MMNINLPTRHECIQAVKEVIRNNAVALVGGLIPAAGRFLTVYHIISPICNYSPGATCLPIFAVGAITFGLLYEINALSFRTINNNIPNFLNVPIIKGYVMAVSAIGSIVALNQILDFLSLSATFFDVFLAAVHLLQFSMVAAGAVFLCILLLILFAVPLLAVAVVVSRFARACGRGIAGLARRIPFPYRARYA